MNDQHNVTQWYLYHSGQQTGPFNWSQIQQFGAKGAITAEDQLWSADQGRWIPAHQIPGLIIPASITQHQLTEGPATLAGFFRMILMGILKQLPKKIVFMVLIFVTVWALHTYLIVVPNGGFAKVKNQLFGTILALQGKVLTGTLFWMVFMGLAVTVLSRLKQLGFERFIQSFSDTGKVLSTSIKTIGEKAKLFFPIGIMAGVGVGLMMISGRYGASNRLLNLMLALSVMMSLCQGESSVLKLILRLAVSDIARLSNSRPPTYSLGHTLNVAIVGLAIGFALVAVLPFLPITGYLLLSAAFLFVVIVFAMQADRMKQSGLGLWILIGLMTFASFGTAYGHDAGWSECDKGDLTVWDGALGVWIECPGAQTVGLFGVGPALGAALAFILASLFSNLSWMSTFPVLPGPLPIPPTRTPQEIWENPRIHDRITSGDGKEYVYYQPAGEVAGPNWVELEAYEKEQYHQSQDHVYNNGVWMNSDDANRHNAWNQEQRQRTEAENQVRRDDYERKQREKEFEEKQRILREEQNRQRKKEILREIQNAYYEEAKAWKDVEIAAEYAEKVYSTTEKLADNIMNYFDKTAGPMGKYVNAGYMVNKNILNALAEHGVNLDAFKLGMAKGAASVVKNELENEYIKSAITMANSLANEMYKNGYNGINEGLTNGLKDIAIDFVKARISKDNHKLNLVTESMVDITATWYL